MFIPIYVPFVNHFDDLRLLVVDNQFATSFSRQIFHGVVVIRFVTGDLGLFGNLKLVPLHASGVSRNSML
jgi:hypothetical protein